VANTNIVERNIAHLQPAGATLCRRRSTGLALASVVLWVTTKSGRSPLQNSDDEGNDFFAKFRSPKALVEIGTRGSG
jgi:hypothetical protein